MVSLLDLILNLFTDADKMESAVETMKLKLTDNKIINSNTEIKDVPAISSELSEYAGVIRSEGGEGLYNYVEWLGLITDPDLIVLSSHHHYYYEEEDLKNVHTVVNLKPLNQIKNPVVMLDSIFRLVPEKSSFIGFFAGNGKHNDKKSEVNGEQSEDIENGISSRFSFLNMIYSLIDSRTNRSLTRKEVTLLFESHGFRIIDMTDLNGVTYFQAQKVRISPE